MTVSTGILQGIGRAQSASERYEIERRAAAENSTRPAQSTATIRTYGIGSILIAEPYAFDMPFTHEPAVTSGRMMLKGAPSSYQYPLADIGVRQWVKRGSLYTAALLYVSVIVQDLPSGQRPPRPQDAATLGEAARAARDQEMSTATRQKIASMGPADAEVTDERRAYLQELWDGESPTMLAQVTLVHSVTFSGEATKDVPTDAIEGDPAATPRTVSFGVSIGGL